MPDNQRGDLINTSVDFARRHFRALSLIAIAAALLIAPLILEDGSSNIDLLINVFMVASLAVSWNIVAGMVGRINLGHVAFFGLGAMTTRYLWIEYEWAFVPAFVAGGLVATAAAIIVGVPALRLKGIYFSVGTLAMAEALRITVGNVLSRVSALPVAELRSYDITPRYYLFLGVLIVIVAFFFWLKQSKIGLGMMAIREDEEAARSIGINVLWHTMLAFVASAFFAGLAGGAFAYWQRSYYYYYTFNPEWTFDAVLVVFIGGIGTLTGPLIGTAFFVIVRDELASNFVDFHLIIFGVVFIFIVLVFPGGFVDVITKVANRFRSNAKTPDPTISASSERVIP